VPSDTRLEPFPRLMKLLDQNTDRCDFLPLPADAPTVFANPRQPTRLVRVLESISVLTGLQVWPSVTVESSGTGLRLRGLSKNVSGESSVMGSRAGTQL
jgi:hypothetical protein